MDSLVVTGGQRLDGRVRTGGAKNAALPILAATLLGGGECTISNLPQVRDVATMLTLLSLLGVSVKREEGRVVVDATHVHSLEAPYDLVKTMRASILVLGPLLARFGEAVVSLPGGCAIGPRPVDLHLDGLRKLGATVSVDYGYIRARATKLEGQRVDFEIPTVTGTENLLMAACLAKGTTVLNNVAMEPEVVDLADFLVKRGARISGAGSGRLVVEGVLDVAWNRARGHTRPDRSRHVFDRRRHDGRAGRSGPVRTGTPGSRDFQTQAMRRGPVGGDTVDHRRGRNPVTGPGRANVSLPGISHGPASANDGVVVPGGRNQRDDRIGVCREVFARPGIATHGCGDYG